jgi:tRNA A22 N-methylase
MLVWYAIKFLARIFGPMLMQKAASKMQQKMEEQMRGQFGNQNPFQNQNTQQTKKQEFPKEKKKVGEYVDFEEVD